MNRSQNLEMVFSVVVCTFNRAELLYIALQTLCAQTISKSSYEIIVVDNNSHDDTRAVTDGFYHSFPNLRYCMEKRQGLSHARNRGRQEANGSYVAYIDDDCKVPKHWLQTAIEIIEKIDPAVFGGPYYAFYNSSKPYWWKDSYGAFEPSKTARVLTQDRYLRGGNIFIRRSLLEAIGGFDSRYGMEGRKLAYGEETDLQKRIRAMRPDELIYYDPKLYVWHLVRSEKMCLRWNLYSHLIGGRYSYYVFYPDNYQTSRLPRTKMLIQAAITFLRLLVDIFRAIFTRDRKQFPHLQNHLYENTFQHLQTLGLIYERYLHTR